MRRLQEEGEIERVIGFHGSNIESEIFTVFETFNGSFLIIVDRRYVEKVRTIDPLCYLCGVTARRGKETL